MSKNIAFRTISYNNTSLTYQLTRKNIKNINLRIGTNEEIHVSAPLSVSLSRIDTFILGQHDFIDRALAKIRQQKKERPLPILYETGDTVRISGQACTLHVSDTLPLKVWQDGNTLYMNVGNYTDTYIKEDFFRQFLKIRCTQMLPKLIPPLYKKIAPYGVSTPKFSLRYMKTRWGSCTPRRHSVSLNTALAMVPVECAEYVILHELCHFIHPDHSPAFYAFLSQFMPDWKARRQQLNQYPL